PGPLTTSRAVKEAMLHDWGSRDVEFIKMNARVRERLVELAGGEGTHVCVPLQGSGTFIIEAMIGTLVPRPGKLAVLVNRAYDALVASSNKCLEGVPGIGFAIIRQSALEGAKGNPSSLSLDLHDQWVAMEKTRQWRFTPPTHVLAALDQALAEHAAEGGIAGR